MNQSSLPMLTQSTRSSSQTHRAGAARHARKGVTLLFTIGLIVMFVLLGTTFLVVSMHYMRSSRIHNTGRIQWQQPREETRTAFYSIVRGTRDPQSSARFHDLLSDMYDVNGFFGTVALAYHSDDPNTTEDDKHFDVKRRETNGFTPTLVNSRGLIVLQLLDTNNNLPGVQPGNNLVGANVTLSPTTGTYVGQSLTFLSGPAKGITVRIVEYLVHIHPDFAADDPQAPVVYQFVIAPERGESSANIIQNPANLQNASVLINSRPFNGRGFGYTAARAAPNLQNQPQLEVDALVPNRAESFRVSVPSPYAKVAARDWSTFYYAVGASNESYDAVDFQNMLLAAMVTDRPNLGTPPLRVIPSLHRPSLIQYWATNGRDSTAVNQNYLQTSATNNDPNLYAPWYWNQQANWDHNNNFFPLTYREFRRQVIMRPMPWDHPRFSGGNPLFVPGDPDGDGEIWERGPDGQPGIANWDDDRDGQTDNITELGAEGSDDYLEDDTRLLQLLAGVNGFDVWDVDNDGDLVNDSIWVDLGLPIQVDKNGRYYKTLAAILCTDLDGRANVNTSGTKWHINGMYTADATAQVTADGTSTDTLLTRGQGYGPPEINLRPIFVDNNDYMRLLYGFSQGTNPLADLATGRLGRYGYDTFNNVALTPPVPGISGMDVLMSAKFFDHPLATYGGSYGSYMDPNGRFVAVNDINGQPLYDFTTLANEIQDSPYEINMTAKAARGGTSGALSNDMPYSPGELERILRAEDNGASSLPSRLWNNSSTLQANGTNQRLLVTTDSYDLPVPSEATLVDTSIVETYRFLLGLQQDGSVDTSRTDTYAFALSQQNPTPTAQQIAMAVNTQIRGMLPPELIQGTRMNVNRPFGNGQDDNNNGVIDEHCWLPVWGINEAHHNNGVPERIWDALTFFDHNNNGWLPPFGGDGGYLARQDYARHLYCLLMAIRDDDLVLDFDGDDVPTDEEVPYALAQLAINIVDFRDADAIMTAFEFDVDPFDINGWTADGIIDDQSNPDFTGGGGFGGTTGVVWGLERPELLITEAFATHDRRTEDLPAGGGQALQGAGGGLNNDRTLDQRLRPRGSLHLELYNPNTIATSPPAELYSTYNGATGVDLRRLDASGTSPVWRIVIVPYENNVLNRGPVLDSARGNNRFMDYDDFNPRRQLRQNQNVSAAAAQNWERVIYFAEAAPNDEFSDEFPGPMIHQTAAKRRYLVPQAILNRLRPVAPLSYAVIGPEGQIVSNTEYVTPFGRRTDVDEAMPDMKYDETRSIILNPGTSVTSLQPDPNDPVNNMLTQSFNAVAIPIAELSLSEPTDGYTTAGFDPMGGGGEGEYMPVFGEPFDRNSNYPELEENGTKRAFRMIHLQRLANPLAPWDEFNNPYRTVDSAMCDLTVFHGAITVSRQDYARLDYPTQPADNPVRMELASNERGASEAYPGQDLGPNQSRLLWKIDTQQGNLNPLKPAAPSYRSIGDLHFFDYHLFASFGDLNDTWRQPRDLEDPIARSTVAYANQVDKWTTQPEQYVSFPWLTWNNRPFVSQHEMMLVPKSRSSRLGFEFDRGQGQNPNPAFYEWDNIDARFGHLRNWYASRFNNAQQEPTANLYYLFDFTHVPSRFTAAEDYFRSAEFQGLQVYATGSQQTNAFVGVLPYNAPFSLTPTMREPGKINVNTIFDRRIWFGLMGGLDNTNSQIWPGANWNQFVNARRGYVGNNGEILDTGGLQNFSGAGGMPTLFSGVFRESTGGNLVVINTGMRVRPGIESTTLRSNGLLQAVGNSVVGGQSANPLFDAQTNNTYDDALRSAYYRERSRYRLTNLTTTRSNVYAIWITTGRFEFDPQTQQLGQELGWDTGNIERNRSFYLFDRSKAVGYEPGENHNVDKAILVERHIE